MKNPWMSAWLSAANSAAGATKGYWSAELQRQQKAFAREMTRAWSVGASPKKRPSPKRAKKSGS